MEADETRSGSTSASTLPRYDRSPTSSEPGEKILVVKRAESPEGEAWIQAVKMWCLVSQANSVILEVQVDPKAIGQECLEKVSHLATVCPHAFVHCNNDRCTLTYVTYTKRSS
ncbi:hypothetical protein KM043_002602 [Ampulex compressa]|nr:hypothetical protein KM043_002602 [Ampulex compressa]